MATPSAMRLLIVGWDAADWQIIQPLMEAGRMPVLKGLIDQGVRAALRTLEPTLSPILWSSIATGKLGDKHGILGFVEPNPTGEGVRIVSSTTRRTKALWNILTQEGKRVHVLGWYASHPAEPVAGVSVSNLYNRADAPPAGGEWPMQEGTVHGPPELVQQLRELRVNHVMARGELLRQLLPAGGRPASGDKRPDLLAAEWGRARSIHQAALAVLEADRRAGVTWECAMIFYDAIDTIGHHVMECRAPRMAHVQAADVRLYGGVMDRVYEHHDRMLGELLRVAGPDVTVMLLSDHGFYSGQDRPVPEAWRHETGAVAEARWHRPEGVLVLSGPGFQRQQSIAAPTLLDITPTALAVLGVPVGEDMDGRVITEAFASPPAIATIPSWDERPGSAGMHPPEMRQDPFEAHGALKQLIELGYMADFGQDHAAQLDEVERETRFNLATVYMTTARPELAIPIFAELTARQPKQRRYVIPLAQCQFATGSYADCVATLRAFMQHDATLPDAHLLLAGALHAMGDTAGAAAETAALEREHGKRPAMALPLASLLAAQERWVEADRYFAAAMAHAPRDPAVRVAAAHSALAQGQYERAAEYCLDATEIQMALPEAHYLLGVALAWLGDLEHAEAALGHAVVMAPGLLDALRFLEAVQQARGNTTAAAQTHARMQELEAKASSRLRAGSERVIPWSPERWRAACMRAS